MIYLFQISRQENTKAGEKLDFDPGTDNELESLVLDKCGANEKRVQQSSVELKNSMFV